MTKKLKYLAGLLMFAMTMTSFSYAEKRDAKAVEVIKAMSEFLGEAERLKVKLNDTIEKVDDEGQVIHYSHNRSLMLERPHHLRVDVTGDLEHDSVFFKSGEFKLVLWDEDLYAETETPKTVTEMLDYMSTKYGVRRPAGDLLRENIYANIEDEVEIRYLGEHLAGSHVCHHIALRGEIMDAQLWIDAGNQPVLRKLVIVYKDLPEQLRYVMNVEAITMPTDFEDGLFELSTDTLEEIPFRPLETKEEGE